MKWFGDSWGAPVCTELEKVPVPITELCFACGGEFVELDRGLVLPYDDKSGTRDTFWHRTCFLKSITGK